MTLRRVSGAGRTIEISTDITATSDSIITEATGVPSVKSAEEFNKTLQAANKMTEFMVGTPGIGEVLA